MDAIEALRREECTYTPFYCEENIWKLCDRLSHKEGALSQAHVVFVSNERRCVPLWRQRAGDARREGLVLWDYHVFLVVKDETSVILDFDTTLAFSSEFKLYIEEALKHADEENIKAEFRRCFRVVSASTFLRTFSSDRSHMLKENGEYAKPPPKYPPILAESGGVDLQMWISMTEREGLGKVMDMKEFVRTFS